MIEDKIYGIEENANGSVLFCRTGTPLQNAMMLPKINVLFYPMTEEDSENEMETDVNI